MKKDKPKAIIFDAFDVLISDGIRGMARKLAREMGLSDWPEFFQELPFWQDNWEKLWKGEINEKQMEEGITPHLGKEKTERFFAGWQGLTKADNKMLDLLKEIRRKKEFKLGFLVNTPPKLLEYLKQEIPLSLFDETLFSCEQGLIKPEIRIYRIIIKKLRVKPEECLLIDNSQENIKTAKKLGMKTIRFKDYKTLKRRLKQKGIL
jgi:putative hydrolase of the HAD superfamily